MEEHSKGVGPFPVVQTFLVRFVHKAVHSYAIQLIWKTVSVEKSLLARWASTTSTARLLQQREYSTGKVSKDLA